MRWIAAGTCRSMIGTTSGRGAWPIVSIPRTRCCIPCSLFAVRHGLDDRVEKAVERVAADKAGGEHFHRPGGFPALEAQDEGADRDAGEDRQARDRVRDQQTRRE